MHKQNHGLRMELNLTGQLPVLPFIELMASISALPTRTQRHSDYAALLDLQNHLPSQDIWLPYPSDTELLQVKRIDLNPNVRVIS